MKHTTFMFKVTQFIITICKKSFGIGCMLMESQDNNEGSLVTGRLLFCRRKLVHYTNVSHLMTSFTKFFPQSSLYYNSCYQTGFVLDFF